MPQINAPEFNLDTAVKMVLFATGMFAEEHYPNQAQDTRPDKVRLFEKKLQTAGGSELIAILASEVFGVEVKGGIAPSRSTAKPAFLVALVPVKPFGVVDVNTTNANGLKYDVPYLVVSTKDKVRVRNGSLLYAFPPSFYTDNYRPASEAEIKSLVKGLHDVRPLRTAKLFNVKNGDSPSEE